MPIENKAAVTELPLIDAIAKRWSPRAFAVDKMLDEQAIATLLEAARWTPSCFNEQPWRFLLANKAQDAETHAKLLDCLVPKNQEWAQNAPVLLVFAAQEAFTHNQKPNAWADYDTGAAAMALSLQANAMGLVCHQMGGFDAEKITSTFALSASVKPIAVMAIGYEGELSVLSAEFQEREIAPRERRSLAELSLN